ncbi:hypothetical protein SAMN05216480_112142 [Pustulibacterium marinum]|uniref:DUF1735 domain-containing protein n=1 Tax=Pustulibacterium marinum TaxID=1224947 RepID=A0A1I7I3P6_9FLAO|nr:hypothetical protein [Pustulibacterium marinum]SFU67551.1 hypothetical protein SAMN05216480_112142 [Pustulibacterium marinum]
MKKLLAFVLIGILFASCSSDDANEVDCSLFDPVFPELYIRLVDDTGANLIENGTVNPENITVEGNFESPGFWYIPPNEFANPDADIRKYDHTLSLSIPNESNFEYTIHLNSTTTIVLNVEAKFVELPCGVSYFVPTKLTYNNQNIISENAATDEFIFLAEIEL